MDDQQKYEQWKNAKISRYIVLAIFLFTNWVNMFGRPGSRVIDLIVVVSFGAFIVLGIRERVIRKQHNLPAKLGF